MPLYDLMYIVKPYVRRRELADILMRTGRYVFANGGVVTKVENFGCRELAYDFKVQGETFDEGNVLQLSFMTAPKHLAELEHQVKVDERVMRYMFWKAGDFPSLKALKDEAKHKEYERKQDVLHEDVADASVDGKGNVVSKSPSGIAFSLPSNLSNNPSPFSSSPF